MQIVLSKNEKEGHWQVLVNGDGPYLIGSTIDIPGEIVRKKLRQNNLRATVTLKKD